MEFMELVGCVSVANDTLVYKGYKGAYSSSFSSQNGDK